MSVLYSFPKARNTFIKISNLNLNFCRSKFFGLFARTHVCCQFRFVILMCVRQLNNLITCWSCSTDICSGCRLCRSLPPHHIYSTTNFHHHNTFSNHRFIFVFQFKLKFLISFWIQNIFLFTPFSMTFWKIMNIVTK